MPSKPKKRQTPKPPPLSKTPVKSHFSKKILASNYYSEQQKRNRKILKKQKPAKKKAKRSFSKSPFAMRDRCLKWLSRYFKKVGRKRALKKDKRIKKRAAYLSDLNAQQGRRFFHKLRPGRFLRFVFSVRGLILGIKIAIFLMILGFASLAGLYLHYRQDVPTSIASLQSCLEGQTTEYWDSTDRVLLWSSKSDFDCQPIQLDEVSPYLIDALLTVEDRNFYEHRGIELKAVARAGLNNLFNNEVQGGSTITQQYVKNAILQDSSRTFDRKIKEVISALEIERVFEKDEILTAYLNTISFGSIYNGAEAAAQGYFNKPAVELTLDEAALLVAAIPAPTVYWNNPDDHVERQRWILGEMLRIGHISQTEYNQASSVITLNKVRTSHEQYEDIRAPHFVLEAEKRLTEALCQLETEEAETGEPQENCGNIRLKGYRIVTTLDMEAQKLAEDTIEKVIPTIVDKDFDNAALVAVDVETGKVIAQVGSRDFKYPGFGQTNTITQQRDPGSGFKIFDYGALIENSTGWGPGSTLYDYETVFDNRGWTSRNYDGEHAGPITVRRALGRSVNIPAIKAMYIAGVDTVHNFAYKAGIETPFPCSGGCGLASAHGGGVEVRLDELTNAYATFSRSGIHVPLTYIDQVFDAEGKLLRQWRQRPERVFRLETAYLLNHILADKSARYTSAYNLDAAVETTMALKTGTDDKFRNNSIVGYTKAVAVGGWIGHHDQAYEHETERNTTAPKALMIKNFMEQYHRGVAYEKRTHWTRPAGIKKVKVNLLTGYQVSDEDIEDEEDENKKYIREDIFPSWYVPKILPAGNQNNIQIDRISGKIATSCTPLRAIETVEATKITDEISIDDPFYENWHTPIIEGLYEQFELTALTNAKDDTHDCDDELPSIKILQAPEICYQTCAIKLEIEGGTFDLSQLNFIHAGQILSNGAISLSGQQQTVDYVYDPYAVNTAFRFRGAIKAEVIDEALYSHEIDILFNIDGLPSPEIPTENINLSSVDLDLAGGTAHLSWRGLGRNLKLHFAQACQNTNPLDIASGASYVDITINNLPTGICEVYLVYNNGLVSNSLEFSIDQST